MRKRTIRSTATSSMDICDCKNRRGATGLIDSPKVRGQVIWVCAECFLPSRPIYEKHIKRCEDCLDEFSNPWSEVCKKCYSISNSDIELIEGRVVRTPHEGVEPYEGWQQGACRERERRSRVERRHLTYNKEGSEIPGG